jgi:NADPH-dependent F420 reductase
VTEHEATTPTLITIAVVGGTGKEGAGLALRWANSGYRVIIGSRDAARAKAKAEELNRTLGNNYLHGTDNASAAHEADVVVISVPYDAHKTTVESLRDALKNKIVVDVTVPSQPPDIRRVFVPDGKSACLEAQAILGESARVVAAFQNVSHTHLSKLAHTLDCDVLVCSDDEAAKNEVMKLVQATGMRGIDAGPLANAVAVEAFTPVLMYINKRYKVKGSGIIITGLPQ